MLLWKQLFSPFPLLLLLATTSAIATRTSTSRRKKRKNMKEQQTNRRRNDKQKHVKKKHKQANVDQQETLEQGPQSLQEKNMIINYCKTMQNILCKHANTRWKIVMNKSETKTAFSATKVVRQCETSETPSQACCWWIGRLGRFRRRGFVASVILLSCSTLLDHDKTEFPSISIHFRFLPSLLPSFGPCSSFFMLLAFLSLFISLYLVLPCSSIVFLCFSDENAWCLWPLTLP